jgi:tryptophan synthase alpha subunit
LQNYLNTTICAPETSDYAPPRWCDAIAGITFVDGTLTVRTTLTATNQDDLKQMLQGLSSFTDNPLYQKYGIKEIEIVSAVDGSTLLRR